MFSMTLRPTLSRAFSTASSLNAPIKEVVVIGGGLMGAGVAQVAASTGHKVTLVDLDENVLGKSKKRIGDSVARVAKKAFKDDPAAGEKMVQSTMGNLNTATKADEKILANADLVLEAVVENIDLKRKIFAELDKAAPEKTIFASNTSSLPIGDLASATKRADRFGGLHFFNPVPMMKLLEVVRTGATSDDTFNAMLAWGKAMGKKTVSCKDTPGFIVNRLLVPYLMEALRLAERGDGSYEDIDIAMKLGAGHPMGPFELADYIGLDTIKFIIDGWHERFPDVVVFEPSKKLADLVNNNKLGLKTGEGFYKHEKK